MGKEKVAVLPEPVYELIMTLLPCMIDGIAKDWIYVGLLYLIFWQSLSTHGERFIELKDVVDVIDGYCCCICYYFIYCFLLFYIILYKCCYTIFIYYILFLSTI